MQPEEYFPDLVSTLQRGRDFLQEVTQRQLSSLKRQLDFVGGEDVFSSKDHEEVPEGRRSVFQVCNR